MEIHRAIRHGQKWRWPRTCIGALLIVAAGGALFVLFLFPPDRYPFYPQCQFHRLTGLACPGCGALRAMHELMHGHVARAFRRNQLFVLALPVIAGLSARSAWQRLTGKRMYAAPIRARWIWLGLGLVLAFGVVRNLPFVPFDHLGP